MENTFDILKKTIDNSDILVILDTEIISVIQYVLRCLKYKLINKDHQN